MKTLKKLLAAYAVAQKREAEARERYTRAMRKVYVKENCYDPKSEFVNMYDHCVSAEHGVYRHATKCGGHFFSQGRDGKFYEKPSAYCKLAKLEHAYKIAEENLEAFWTVFEAAGINPQDDSEFEEGN